MDAKLEAIISHALDNRRRRTPISFVLFEIDDLNGGLRTERMATEIVLRCAVERLRSPGSVTCLDHGRVAIVLPGLPLEAAMILADGIRHSVGLQPSMFRSRLTVSGGVVSFPQHGRHPDAVVRGLINALLRAQATGGDRVVATRATRGKLADGPRIDPFSELSALANRLGKPEATLLREAVRDLVFKYEATTN